MPKRSLTNGTTPSCDSAVYPLNMAPGIDCDVGCFFMVALLAYCPTPYHLEWFMASTLWLCIGILSPMYLFLLFYRLKRLRLCDRMPFRCLFLVSALFSSMFYLGHLISAAASVVVDVSPFAAASFLHVGDPVHHIGYLAAPACLALTFAASWFYVRNA